MSGPARQRGNDGAMKSTCPVWVFSSLMVLAASGCSNKIDLPETIRGEWRQSGQPDIRLRFEQTGEQATVFLTIAGGKGDWLGPLPLSAAGAEAWSFRIADVTTTSGNSSRTVGAPSASQDIQYGIDQNGRMRQLALTRLAAAGDRVKIRREGAGIAVEGLWLRIENRTWDGQGKPVKQAATLLSVGFER